MKYLFFFLILALFKNLTSAQINFASWKEDISHLSNPDSAIPYDSVVVISESKKQLLLDNNQIAITINYCSKEITTNYAINGQFIEEVYPFDKCGLQRRELKKELYFNRQENNGKFNRYINFDKSRNLLQINEEEQAKIRTVIQFSGEELKVEELGLECKNFYDEPLDHNLYRTDLSLLNGSWFALKDSTKALIKCDPKNFKYDLHSLCSVDSLTNGIVGEMQIIQHKKDTLFFSFYACISEKYEIRVQENRGRGWYDDAYIRKLTNQELIIDYETSYIVFRRKE